jgi:hypothetical protein
MYTLLKSAGCRNGSGLDIHGGRILLPQRSKSELESSRTMQSGGPRKSWRNMTEEEVATEIRTW